MSSPRQFPEQSEPQAQARGGLFDSTASRMNTRALALGAPIGVMLALALALAGCERKPVPERPAPVIPEVKSSTPEEATRSLLLLLQAEMRAVARKDSATAQKARELCATLVAKKGLSREFKNLSVMLGANPVDGLVANWSAAIAAYADTFDFDRLSVPEFTDADKAVGVFVPATGLAGRADLRIECVRDGPSWLISSIAFDGTKAIKVPVSVISGPRPASASAPAPPQANADAPPRP